jgi:hypothetical protein
MVNDLPFVEVGNIRTFDADLDEMKLLWHWDEQDRFVTPCHETDWLFQFDDEEPIELHVGESIFIRAGTWHRLIKGTGSLSLSIVKL